MGWWLTETEQRSDVSGDSEAVRAESGTAGYGGRSVSVVPCAVEPRAGLLKKKDREHFFIFRCTYGLFKY